MDLMLPKRRVLPVQDSDRILLHASRFRRSADALRNWSETAKKCVDYFESRQWSAADIAKLQAEKRPHLVINKIRPLVNLVLGYHINNRSETRYLPGYDGTGTAEVADALTHCEKQISEACQLPFVDSEVFLDGLLTGRGYYDTRLDFRRNSLGEVITRAQDNFSTYPDPDADEYDLNSGSHITTSRWISVEEADHHYGPQVSQMLGPFMQAGGVSSGMPMSIGAVPDELTPIRRFAREEDGAGYWNYNDTFHDFIDPSRKAIRMLDIQHYIRVTRWFFVDLETGDSRPVPDDWPAEKIKRVLAWAAEQGQPVAVQEKTTRRLRWTHMIGDVIAYDDWSPYQTFTITPFFPYFRRGMTQGMVEHLLDSQDEVNKRRSARLNIIGRSSAGGWLYEKGTLDPQQQANLEQFGSTPGVHVKWNSDGGKLAEPKPIPIAVPPVAMAQLEQEADDNLKEIAGINDAALGMIDQSVISGAAIERRQRQTIIGLEHTVANFRRSKELLGRKHLELMQDHMTEQRIIRRTGPGNTPVQKIINERTAAGVVNDLSLGSYAVAIDEQPMSKSFLEAQFEELLNLKQMGMPIPDEFLIDSSSVARKTELKIALAQARQQQAALAATAPPAEGAPGGGPGPGGSKVGPDGGSLPAGPEPGAPPMIPGGPPGAAPPPA